MVGLTTDGYARRKRGVNIIEPLWYVGRDSYFFQLCRRRVEKFFSNFAGDGLKIFFLTLPDIVIDVEIF